MDQVSRIGAWGGVLETAAPFNRSTVQPFSRRILRSRTPNLNSALCETGEPCGVLKATADSSNCNTRAPPPAPPTMHLLVLLSGIESSVRNIHRSGSVQEKGSATGDAGPRGHTSSPGRGKNVRFSIRSSPPLRPIHPPIQWLPVALFPRIKL
jgi:hypothetical protein